MKISAQYKPYIALFMGVVAVSTAAIFIRLAQTEGIPSLPIAAGRLIVASIVLTPIALSRHQVELKQLNRQELGLAMISGVFLALHFATWVASLEYTSVTASVVLVTTNPLFVALLSLPLIGEKVDRLLLIGIFIAFIGGIIVAMSGDAGNPSTRADPLLGNFLAVIGAMAVALYMLIGRRLRAKLSLIPYIWLVYGAAAITLSVVILITQTPFLGYPTVGYAWILAMGLFPQLIGHSSFNYALRYLAAAVVSLVVLAEPVGSSVLAMIFLDEYPSLLAVFGSLIILVGIGLGTGMQRRKVLA